MNLRKKTENTLSTLLTYYGDSLTLFGEMVEVSHRQTPRKDCDAKAPRQDSTISGFRLGIAVPNDRAAASQGCEAVVSVYPETDPLMQGAWYDCLMWAAGEDEIRHAFEEETGMKIKAARSPLDRMIDKATGFDNAIAKAFVEWFNKNIW